MRAEPFTNDSGVRDYWFRPKDEQKDPFITRRTIGKVLIFIAGFVVGFFVHHAHAAPLTETPKVSIDTPCVRLKVRPQIMLNRNDVDVQTRVCRHAAHRELRIEWTSDYGWAGSSRTQLEGATAPVAFQFWIDEMPPANYEFSASVRDAEGKVLSRDRAQIRSPRSEP